MIGRPYVDTWPAGFQIGRGFTGGTGVKLHNFAAVLDGLYNTSYWRSNGVVLVPEQAFMDYANNTEIAETKEQIRDRIRVHNHALGYDGAVNIRLGEITVTEQVDQRSGVFYEVSAFADSAAYIKKQGRNVPPRPHDLAAEQRGAYKFVHQEEFCDDAPLQVPLGVVLPRGSLKFTAGMMRNILNSDSVQLTTVQCRPSDILNVRPRDERPRVDG